jgi:hypothetical protein
MRGHLFALGCAGFLLSACAEASTDQPDGGVLKVDGTPPPPPPAPTSSARIDSGTGTTFTDLYRDLFGPTGAASCSGSGGSCHGTPAPPGGFACGPNKSDCRTSVAALARGADFKSSALFAILRKSNGDGRMPKSSAYAFDGTTMDRIGAWVAAGAKDD